MSEELAYQNQVQVARSRLALRSAREQTSLMHSALRVIGYGDWEMMSEWLDAHGEDIPTHPGNLVIAVARAASREPTSQDEDSADSAERPSAYVGSNGANERWLPPDDEDEAPLGVDW